MAKRRNSRNPWDSRRDANVRHELSLDLSDRGLRPGEGTGWEADKLNALPLNARRSRLRGSEPSAALDSH
eukprot:323298-Chlamydomonas_euryale.AAC.5